MTIRTNRKNNIDVYHIMFSECHGSHVSGLSSCQLCSHRIEWSSTSDVPRDVTNSDDTAHRGIGGKSVYWWEVSADFAALFSPVNFLLQLIISSINPFSPSVQLIGHLCLELLKLFFPRNYICCSYCVQFMLYQSLFRSNESDCRATHLELQI